MDFIANRFKGKNMLVTGGTSGIGKAVCLRAGKEGAFVIVAGRNQQRGDEVLEEITKNGGKGMFISADMEKETEILNLFETIKEQVGSLHIAVNSAGIIGGKERVDELSSSEWLRIINTNLNGVFYCCREESKMMIAQGEGGAIVNLSSVAGSTGVYHLPAYAASKHGVNGLTKAMANDLANFRIRVNSVSPAATITPLVERSLVEVEEWIGKAMAAGKTLKEAKAYINMIGGKTDSLQKRNSTPDEQASTILYMVSDEASHITGSIIMSDGGYTAY